jgi:hypothetical protein
MKTFTVTGYQAYGTNDPSAYFVDVSYRGELLRRFDGERAAEQALRYVAREAGRAIVHMGDKA